MADAAHVHKQAALSSTIIYDVGREWVDALALALGNLRKDTPQARGV